LNIQRMVTDFGNSFGQHMIDGHYFEMPSSIKEISLKDVQGMFAHNIPADSLDEHLVIKFGERYFMAGKRAQAELLGNAHIYTLHDKTKSETVWVTWLAGLALYNALKKPEIDQDNVSIDYFGTLLPVWLVKKASSFKEKLSDMAARFQIEFTYELITPGFQRELTVNVHYAECRIEGENARHALKLDLEGNSKEDAKRYKDAYTVIDDIGGQSQDLCKLQHDLNGAQKADDFVSSTDQSYLAVLEKLRTDKLMDYFKDVRALELFILNHVESREFIYVDSIMHDEHSLTADIEPVLHEFAGVAMQKSLQSFSFMQGDLVYYVHIGGVNQVLREYMMTYLSKQLGETVARKYHIFPEDSRKLNIYASEIVAKNYLKRKEEVGVRIANLE
jgi:plasmid segregation protein ParM